MKAKFRRVLSALLAIVMVSTVMLSMDVSAFAAEVDSVAVEETTPTVEPVVTESATQPSTEPTEAPTTQPATTQPTTQPTTMPSTVPAPVVGTVKNIVKTSFLTDKITLEWDKVSGASGYYIYYRNADKTNTYTKVADVKTNSCTISKLSHTTQYHFKVSAYVTQNGTKYEGKATVKKTATQPGKATVSMVRSSSVIEFKWNRNSLATGYKIYRASGSTNGKYVLYKTIKNNKTTSFADTNVQKGKAYYYCVKPYRELYNTSYTAPSSDIKFICGMSAPNYSMTTQLSRVSLTWNKNKYATGYDIYYATSKNGTYKKLGTTKNDYFNTVKLTNNKTYYFRVQPYKLNGAYKTKVVGTYSTKSIKVTNKAYGQTIGDTYIEISIKQQHMWLYYKGDLYCHTDVVTGNNDGYHNTPKGVYSIFQRTRNTTLVGAGYASHVDYWLAFTYSGVGIHDASWRSNSEYGGNTYKGNGSHGCVNTPYNAVKKIYNKVSIGTKVVVY